MRVPRLAGLRVARLAAAFGLAAGAAAPAVAEVTVAVAANFQSTAESLAEAHGGDVALAMGSTGQLYAHIKAGAPFDIFLAADQERPALLEAEGRSLARRTYALGRLVLVARMPGLDDAGLAEALDRLTGRVAVADPALAPYGEAAMAALDAVGAELGDRIVLGQSVAQAYAFVATGNAEGAFIAASQVPEPLPFEGSVVVIDPGLYPTIRQDAVLLSDNPDARDFWDWLAGPEAAEIIRAAGYGLSE